MDCRAGKTDALNEIFFVFFIVRTEAFFYDCFAFFCLPMRPCRAWPFLGHSPLTKKLYVRDFQSHRVFHFSVADEGAKTFCLFTLNIALGYAKLSLCKTVLIFRFHRANKISQRKKTSTNHRKIDIPIILAGHGKEQRQRITQERYCR